MTHRTQEPVRRRGNATGVDTSTTAGEPGAYDLRWSDIVEATASVTVSSSSYGGGSIDNLSDVDTLASKLQKSRGGNILEKRARVSDGLLYYDYEFDNPNATHELLSLCVNKNRLWQISAKSPEKSWKKREELFRNVVRLPARRHLTSSSSFPGWQLCSQALGWLAPASYIPQRFNFLVTRPSTEMPCRRSLATALSVACEVARAGWIDPQVALSRPRLCREGPPQTPHWANSTVSHSTSAVHQLVFSDEWV